MKAIELIEQNHENLTGLSITLKADEPIHLGEYRESLFNIEPGNGKHDEGVNFQQDSFSYLVAKEFNEGENGWYSTKEVRYELGGEDTPLDESNLSQVLWDLTERGVLDKRDHDGDGRMKEYRITESGRASVTNSS